MTRRIRLTNGKYTMVSDHRYKGLRSFVWFDHGDGYAARHTGRTPDGKQHTILMHRQILGLKIGNKTCVDHINGKRRDNRDENLRKANRFDNAHNRTKYACNKSGYKGVSWHRRAWNARIKFNGKVFHLGCFDKKKDAAYAYDNAARKYFGEFAQTNFKDVKDDSLLRSRRTRNSPRWGKVKRTRRVYWGGYDGIKVGNASNYKGTYQASRRRRGLVNPV